MGTAFYTLRQRLAWMMAGESLTGVPAAAPPTLTTDTFGVSAFQSYGDDYFNDWFGRFYDGPKAGTDFVISDFEQLNGKLVLATAVSSVILVTDKFEMYPEYSPEELGRAINLAISSVEGEALEDAIDDTIALSSTMFEYEVPAGISHIEALYREGELSGRFSLKDDLISPRHWNLKRMGTKAQIWFDPTYAALPNGRHLRIIGQRKPSQLVRDSDVSNINELFVLEQAKAFVHQGRVRGSNADFEGHERQMGIAQQMADRERSRVRVSGRGHQVSYP